MYGELKKRYSIYLAEHLTVLTPFSYASRIGEICIYAHALST